MRLSILRPWAGLTARPPHGSPASRLARLTARPPHGSPASRRARPDLTALPTALACALLMLALSLPRTALAQYPGGGSYGYSSDNPNGPYSGGTFTAQSGNNPPYPTPYFLNTSGEYSGYYGIDSEADANPYQSATATASGTIKAIYTWNGGSGNLPTPPSLVKVETCKTVWSGPAAGNGAGPATGSLSNPLGGSAQNTSPGPGQTWDAVKYTAVSNPPTPFSCSLSPSATSSWTAGSHYGSAHAGVEYQVQLYVPTVNLAGPIQDSSHNWETLVGQGITASLTGLPPGCQESNFSCSVTGKAFSAWTVAPDDSSAKVSSGISINSTNNTAHWYWADQQNTYVVTCTATLTPPLGDGSHFQVTASQNVNLEVPAVTASGTAGEVWINTHCPSKGAGLNGILALYAGPTATEQQPPQSLTEGMNFTGKAVTPSDFSPLSTQFSTQMVTPEFSRTAGGQTQYTSHSGDVGLDAHFPYAGYWGAAQVGTWGDSPNIGGLSNTYTAYTMWPILQNFYLYQPAPSPTGAQNDIKAVTMGTLGWSVAAYPTIPTLNDVSSWSLWDPNTPAGSVSPPGTTSFSISVDYPTQWTMLIPSPDNTWIP